VAGHDASTAGRVRITTGDDIAAIVIALPEFERQFPDISLEVIARFELVSLTRREADVALRTVRPNQGDFLVRHAGWWELGLLRRQNLCANAWAAPWDTKPCGGANHHMER
jgi:DNA-binding transcriptional LysR family regulator